MFRAPKQFGCLTVNRKGSLSSLDAYWELACIIRCQQPTVTLALCFSSGQWMQEPVVLPLSTCTMCLPALSTTLLLPSEKHRANHIPKCTVPQAALGGVNRDLDIINMLSWALKTSLLGENCPDVSSRLCHDLWITGVRKEKEERREELLWRNMLGVCLIPGPNSAPWPAGCCPRGWCVIPQAKIGPSYDAASALPDEMPYCGMELMGQRVDFSLFDALCSRISFRTSLWAVTTFVSWRWCHSCSYEVRATQIQAEELLRTCTNLAEISCGMTRM